MEIGEAANFGADPRVLEALEDAGVSEFTRAQSLAIESGLCRGKSLLIAAPTSSGKTTIAELAAIHGALRGSRTVYLVSHRALAEEKFNAFRDRYGSGDDRWFEVSLATGDRVEGRWDDGILVATYEKFLAYLSGTSTLSVAGMVVVADEIQIIADTTRGHDVEVLCSIIKRQRPSQFIGLSATATNARDLADWMGCECVDIAYRDVALRQEVWHRGRRYFGYHGKSEVIEDEDREIVSADTLEAVSKLLERGLGPVLVFTMTRPRAISLATAFSRSREQNTQSHHVADQLSLFSEPTQLADMLRGTTERRVGFHSADLSFSERSVVERALRDRQLDVVFATPTLAAGVNFPIRTVLFDSFSRSWLPNAPFISQAEYMNMSGRAGRLGMHDEGLSILLASNTVEATVANRFLSEEAEPIESTLLNRSLRKTVLHLVASRIARSEDDLNSFFRETLWWYQTQEHNPAKLETVAPLVADAIAWHLENGLMSGEPRSLFTSPLGVALASTGLLPSTGVTLLSLITQNASSFDGDDFEVALVHAVCACDEFGEETGQRFLPYANRGQPEVPAWQLVNSTPLYLNPSGVENYDRVTNATFALKHWCEGMSERDLRHRIRRISYGHLHVLAADVSWVLEGLSSISAAPGVELGNSIPTKIKLLAERVRFGVPATALDVMNSAHDYSVPGLGRQRAMKLVAENLIEPNVLVKADLHVVSRVLESEERARALVDAIGRRFSTSFEYWKARHIREAGDLDPASDLVARCYGAIGHEYEDTVEAILSEVGFEVTKLDKGKRQGMPDFLIEFGAGSAIAECKTKVSDDATISKDDAFAVLTKSADIDAQKLITIGKPDFDAFSKSKAAGSKRITLVPHSSLIEAYIQCKMGALSIDQFFVWITRPGVAESWMLPGRVDLR